jgi:hypothetical protein
LEFSVIFFDDGDVWSYCFWAAGGCLNVVCASNKILFQVQTEFQPISEVQFVATIPDADSINHIVVFLTGAIPFPEGTAGQGTTTDPNQPPKHFFVCSLFQLARPYRPPELATPGPHLQHEAVGDFQDFVVEEIGGDGELHEHTVRAEPHRAQRADRNRDCTVIEHQRGDIAEQPLKQHHFRPQNVR